MPHYPQDEGPLCCCEYLNRHGERAHVLGLCCACEEIDRAADDLVHGQVPSRDRIDEALLELDDRLRLPTPGGAVHLGVAGTLPWFILPWPLLFGAISARMLLVCAVALVPALAFWHRRVLRLRRRTGFLFWWQLASIAYECTAYTLLLALHQTRAETALFFIPLVTSMLLLFRMQCVDATSARGAADEAGANARAARCPVSGHLVPRYDHYCAWTDRPICAANHRAYFGFVATLLLCVLVGGVQLWRAGIGWRALVLHNASSLATSCAAYALAVAVALAMLLAHQVILLARGLTAYEARRRDRVADEQARRTAPLSSHLHAFWSQTVPVIGWAVAGQGARNSESTKGA